MRTLLFTLLFAFMLGCNNPTGSKDAGTKDTTSVKDSVSTSAIKDSSLSYIHRFGDTLLENKITSALMKLPFVKRSNTYIDSFTNHLHGIAFMLDSAGNNGKEISVQAGYNGDQRFETYYRFFVNPKTMEIKVYDAVNDKKLSVKEYLKSQH